MPNAVSQQLLGHWVDSLTSHLPFSRMDPAHVRQLAEVASERYFAPDELVLDGGAGRPDHLIFIRQGRMLGRRQGGSDTRDVFELEAGSLLPVAALLADRPVTSSYSALEDCFCLMIPRAQVVQVMGLSAVWADFLQGRMMALLTDLKERWHRELQGRLMDQQILERRLADLPVHEPVTRPASTSLQEVLAVMRERRIGSVLLTDEEGGLGGILTRSDVLERIALPGLSLQTPADRVMSRPVHTIDAQSTAFEAALMMSRLGLRHLPVMAGQRLSSVVSERDLFAWQNQSIKGIATAIAQARTAEQLRHAAGQIRLLAAQLMAQGLQSARLTRLISHHNDSLTQRIIALALERHGLSEQQMCWMALGSEGRAEQTIATDQDNALIYESDEPERDQPRWLAFASEVNQTLDDCGYPLCKGGVMASNPQCCLTLGQWRLRFAQWIEQGSAQELLKASVFFDLRALAGRAEWVSQLASAMRQQAQQTPRFIAQWVHNHLNMSVPLNWLGGLHTQTQDGIEVIDLKMSGTAIVVDAARILALSQGIDAHSTADRLEQAGEKLGIPVSEYRGWITAFDHLQDWRLRRQVSGLQDPAQANSVNVTQLDLVDRQVLKASFSAIRTLQQRLRLDYVR